MKILKKALCTSLAVMTITTGTSLSSMVNSGIYNSEPAIVQMIDADAAGYTTGTYQVNTSSGVNVRSGAGTKHSKLGAATNGTKFKVTKVSGDWGYGSIKCTNGTKKGWVCLTYTKRINSEDSSSKYKTGTYKINTSSGSNVRKGAGTSYDKVGAATNGTQFKVTKISGDWGYTSSIKCSNGTKSGWVCLKYAKVVVPNPVPVITSAKFKNAYNYAKKYWNKRNYNYKYYSGNNCANFVSQCLVAGGIPTSSTWKNGTYAFINCTGLKNYFINNYKVTYKKNPSSSAIKPGDVIYTDNGGHVMFVMKVSGNTIYASGNTNNRDCLALTTRSICGVLQTSKLLK